MLTAGPNNYKFTSKERDGESGLDYFGARHYSSATGRFMVPDWAARPTSVPYADFGDPESLNLYGYVRNDPISRADADGHGGGCGHGSDGHAYCTMTNDDGPGPPLIGEGSDNPVQESVHTGNLGLLRDWLDVVEVSGSYGWSAGFSGQAGSEVKYEATAGITTEGTIGLGGGNGEVKVSGDVVNGKLKLADYEGSVKVGVEASSKEGLKAQASAEVSAGPVKAGVSVDRTGVHASAGTEKRSDTKLGGHVHAGLGLGVNINFSQAGRAWDRSVQSVNALGQYLMNRFMPTGGLF